MKRTSKKTPNSLKATNDSLNLQQGNEQSSLFDIATDERVEVVLLSFKLDESALNDGVLKEAYAQICKD